MAKTAVIYWSGTGNTQAMAEAIVSGLKSGGDEVALFNVSDISPDKALGYDKLALGCSSMGAEVLEESEFEPFFTELEKSLSGKKVALFGSYGWGDGEWMRDWQERTDSKGANLFEDGLIVNEMPDAEGISLCEAFGKRFAQY